MTSEPARFEPTTSRRSDDEPEMRELTDPRTMRALTHPVRLALLEVLAIEGPLTATAAGERINESPTTCSFHFRQLAKYGFVEEAGGGTGRQRPWKLAHVGMRFSDSHDDLELSVAAKSLERMLLDRAFARLQAFLDTKGAYPEAWQAATESTEAILLVTPEELAAVNREIIDILNRFRGRLTDRSLRPTNGLPVEILVFSYPVRLPGEPT